jgi:acetyltransferase-like isoleucine patch superfamily enzyme
MNNHNLAIDIINWIKRHLTNPLGLVIKAFKGFVVLLRMFIYKLFYQKSLSINGIIYSLPSNISIDKGTIYIGNKCNISKNTNLSVLDNGRLDIGERNFFNNNCNIVCRNSIKIGNGCRFGPNICIYDHDHIFNETGVTDEYKSGTINIGDNCWFGANVVILKDTDIGEGCVIGAGCIIKGVIPAHTLVKKEDKLILTKIVKQVAK